MNPTLSLVGRTGYAKLTSAPLGLLLAVGTLHEVAAAAGPSASVVAVDLLALALGGLVGWLGGELAATRHAPAARRARRPRTRSGISHRALGRHAGARG